MRRVRDRAAECKRDFERIETSVRERVAGERPTQGGTCFFALDHRLRYGHFVWHLFVISGAACHFLAVFWYAAGT